MVKINYNASSAIDKLTTKIKKHLKADATHVTKLTKN